MSNKKKTILVIDLECTCFEGETPTTRVHPHRGEIIEIGITPVTIETTKLGESKSIIVHPPTMEITPFCTKLTTLTPEYVQEQGVQFEKAVEILKREYKSANAVFASWGMFDWTSFQNNCQWNNVKFPFPNLFLNIKALFASQYGITGGLKTCLDHLEMSFEGTPHRGVDDSRMTAKILIELLGPRIINGYVNLDAFA